jgi:UPF0271 protein
MAEAQQSGTRRIDLNADMGESFGPWPMGHDERLMSSITSANIACGFHAGDPQVMRRTLGLARTHGVAVGAHPGFPDLVGFGRREMRASPAEIEDFVLYQVAALAGMARAEGLTLQHVKAHGALYNMAAGDETLAAAIARGVAAFDRSLILFGLPNSALLTAGRAAGLRVAAEAFADRAYDPDGSLQSRSKPGSVIHDPQTVVARAVRMVTTGAVVATNGTTIALEADTLCLHGDTPGAADLAARVREALEQAGVQVTSIIAPRG